MERTYTFHVIGMHCDACVLLTESELTDTPDIVRACSNLADCTVEVTGMFGEREPREIAATLTGVLSKHGYSLVTERPASRKRWGEFLYAAPIAGAFIAAFIALQKAGLVNLVTASDVTYGTAFVVGVIASLSTCMAVVGGLVLSMSATWAKQGRKAAPQILFHAGRLVSFFLLGGAIGALGAAFQLSGTSAFILALLVGAVMLALGVNLLDIWGGARKFRIPMPKAISGRALKVTSLNHALAPLLVGVVTFFLPCGFTQSMQVYTLSTGSFLRGGLTMLAFALGTLPVLALVSFGSFSIERSRYKGVFFKTAGLVVIIFALFNLLSAFAAAGLIRPIFNL